MYVSDGCVVRIIEESVVCEKGFVVDCVECDDLGGIIRGVF